MAWGSDALAELLRRLDLPYVSLVPGSSYRGLHDSLVNYLGNERPQMLVCLHEEHAIAIAHGYAKVTGRPMAAALHSNVGLMHATMAFFNAFCDRVPMLVLGATGPLDATQRRPWIDWIHTAIDQAALVRNFTKWDDQPSSIPATLEAVVRADRMARSYPSAPTYVCVDSALQEGALDATPEIPPLERYAVPRPLPPDPDTAARVAQLLTAAERPLILAGRVSRDPAAWEARKLLAERLGACVLTDLKTAAAFPTDHPLHPAPPGVFPTPAALDLLRRADVVLSLDWLDLGGTLRQAHGRGAVPATIVSCTNDSVLHNGWSKDHFELPAVDVAIASHPDVVVPALLERIPATPRRRPDWPDAGAAGGAAAGAAAVGGAGGSVTMSGLAGALRVALGGRDVCLAGLPLGWRGEDWTFRHPLDYFGHQGGAGIGAGPGLAVGAALGLAGSGRLPVAILGDGDYLMGASALWTAAHYRLPLLVVVANNRSFFNDEIHQQRVALTRGRPTDNRWVGQRISDPDPDLGQMARSMGLAGYGPVSEPHQLDRILERAVDEAANGAAVVVDVWVDTRDYPGAAAAVPGKAGARS
jgi:thiamine pyrophosphate-dependent acetolactate synthase large subunit-like protein